MKAWVIMWSEAVRSNDVDAFIAEWHIADERCTPTRGKKRAMPFSAEFSAEESDDLARE